jgi:hypothetical protein
MMKFNKNDEIWKSAPWYVKLSVLGVPSLRALYGYAYTTFFVGLLFFTSGLFLPLLVTKSVFELIFTGSGLALASCIYLFAITWVKDKLSCQN